MLNSFLQRLPGVKKARPRQVTSPVGEVKPQAEQQDDFIFGPPSRVDTSGFERERQGYLNTLSKAPPAAAKAEIDPIEAIISFIAGQGVQDPGTLGRVQGIPLGLAQGRADLTNQTNQQAFEQSQKTAQIGLQSADRMIGGAWDANSAADRVEAQLKMKAMADQTKQALAMLKTNKDFALKAAELIGKGQMTPGALTQAIIQSGVAPEIAPDAAKQLADSYFAGDPSLRVQLDQAGQELKETKQQSEQVEKIRKIAEDDDQVSPEGRYKAMFQLRSMGVPGYAEMTLEELKQHAEALSPAGRAKEAQTKLLGERGVLLAAQTGLTKARADKLAKETEFLDENQALKVAETNAKIDNLKSLIKDRGVRSGQTLDKETNKNFQAALKSVDASERELTKELNRLRTSLSVARKASEPDKTVITRISNQIIQLQDQLKQIHADKQELQTALTGTAMRGANTQPKQGKTRSGASFTYTPN